eukprot:CAMPEP_0179110410 /NCGR_PEP_ID=MMETSP0796-20121207/51526_1 /TAXON_ID=73915 /ORGANISM="Pyrodinium bahamense, Strain pbaha01" /LENGTH=75 /DNA_ID=CAMNT_0020808541 /DNA_START=61 /DNA_END=288 /DNA_ORIENTATION=-
MDDSSRSSSSFLEVAAYVGITPTREALCGSGAGWGFASLLPDARRNLSSRRIARCRKPRQRPTAAAPPMERSLVG